MTGHIPKASLPTSDQVVAELEKRFGFNFEEERERLAEGPDQRGLSISGEVWLSLDPGDMDTVSNRRWRVRRKKRWGKTILEILEADGKGSTSLARLLAGAKGDEVVTFRNGDETDYRRHNLVLCEKRVVRKKPGCASKYKGVYLQRRDGRWYSRIMSDGISKHLGFYDTEEAAAYAYDKAARDAFGAAARLNFPQEGERSALDYD